MVSLTAVIEDMNTTLDAQIAAIREGRIEGLLPLSAQLEGLIADARDCAAQGSADMLEAVRRKAEGVHAQMTYVLRGVRDARRQVDAALGLPSSMDTYGRDGHRLVIRSGSIGLERRV
jgi:uncharacterized protein (DUF885 family)